ncbi:MAG: NADH-quinone oxidoreductase subunit C [Proteobacteria bacterium]|nr:NADH-quinone oxidoreductase subunit C [Pseudomonadota bacterium]MBU1716183.1 NADH-quinone oxidoreductase subunit C [Pseudomonadota bacterium]
MIAKIKQQMSEITSAKITETEYAAKGYHLDVEVPADQVVTAAEILDAEKFYLEAVTGVDWMGAKAAELAAKKAAAAKAALDAAKKAAAEAEGEEKPETVAAPVAESVEEVEEDLEEEMEVVYDYNHAEELCRVVVRCRVPRLSPELPTISEVFPGANWHERETHDFFGIKFIGHPDLSPLLLPEDADFHPLLKDFSA